jgi:hypothetical protein
MTPRLPTPDVPPPDPLSEAKRIEMPASPPDPSIAVTHEPEHRRCPDVDLETGQLRRIPADEWRSRQDELTTQLAQIDAEDDTPDEVYDEFMRNLDEERRRQGRPPAFEGCY